MMNSQNNYTPGVNAKQHRDVSKQVTHQNTAVSDVGRYRRSYMRQTSKLNRSASTSSSGETPFRSRLSTCSFSSSGSVCSERSCVSLDIVDRWSSLQAVESARRDQPALLPRSRSETRFGFKPRTRLLKLSHSSDSGVVLKSSSMHQENRINRSPSVSAVLTTSETAEAAVTPKSKTLPHPKKKMLRSHSESAIDVTMLRTVKNLQGSSENVTNQTSGIVCSNEDLMKILTNANKQKFSRKRNSTVVSRLDATPELPLENLTTREAETCLNAAAVNDEQTTSLPISPAKNVSPRSWSTRHHSMRITNNCNSSDLTRRAADLQNWSPKHNGNQTANNFSASKMFARGEKRNSNGYSRVRPYSSTQCPAELEPMLGESTESDHDDNGNIAEETPDTKLSSSKPPTCNLPDQPTISEENEPSTSATPPASKSIVCTGFDPELLGQAIERHLSIAKVSPTDESKPEAAQRSRSGSIKNMWTQNRISNLVTRFPFRRENSTTAAV